MGGGLRGSGGQVGGWGSRGGGTLRGRWSLGVVAVSSGGV